MASFEINNNHRRALESALNHVEQVLHEFTWLINQSGAQSSSPLPAAQKQDLLARIAMVQQQVDDFRARFKIPARRPRDLAWAIQVGVSRLWEILEDCKADQMRGYGEVPEATKPVLDTEVQKLIEALENIAVTARAGKTGA